MNHRVLWFGFWLAATPLAAQIPSLSTYHNGALHLSLSPTEPSQIGFAESELEDLLCGGTQERTSGGSTEGGGTAMPGETCRLVIQNDGSNGGLLREAGGPPITVATTTAIANLCATNFVSLLPTSLSLKSKDPLATTCGTWSFTAELAPSGGVPALLSLLSAPPVPSTGQFTGVLPLNLNLVFTRTDWTSELASPPTVSALLALQLDVAGRWTVIQPSNPGTASLPNGETNLALFADRQPGADGTWTRRVGCASAHGKCTKLCFVASTRTLAALNGVFTSVW